MTVLLLLFAGSSCHSGMRRASSSPDLSGAIPPASLKKEAPSLQRGEFTDKSGKPPSLWRDPLLALIHRHQERDTHLDGARCPLYPSCSAYGARALREYPVRGFFLTVDRLFFLERGVLYEKFMKAPRRLSRSLRYYDPLEDSLPGHRPSLFTEEFSD